MTTQEINQEHLSLEEAKFQDCLQRGEDFCKVELFRNAIVWYRRALEMKPDDPVIRERYENCQQQIGAENRVIYILLGIVAVIVAVVLIIRAV